MNLSHLQSFYTTVKSNSISKAAKELHLSQPGLSMQLQNFENDIGEQLLIRSNKGISLTKEGELVFEFAESMLSLKYNLDKKIKELKESKNNLSISACSSLGEQILPCSIYTFKEIHFNVNASMHIDNSSNILKGILNHQSNIGIIHEIDYIPDNITTKTILSDKLILVSSNNSSLKEITIEDLKTFPLVIREEGSGTLEILKKSLSNKNLTLDNLNIVLSLNSPEAIKSSVISGYGFALIPELSITHELRSGTLKKINIKDFDTSFHYNIITRKNYSLSEYEEKFFSFLSSKKRCFCY